MQIAAALDRLDEIRRDLSAMVPFVSNEKWRVVKDALALLNIEAERQGVPFGLVRQKTTSLRHHFGLLLRKRKTDGHPLQQHLAWIVGDLQALRSDHCIGKALAAEAATSGASDTMH